MKPSSETEAEEGVDVPAWAVPFQPWLLLATALVIVARQAFVLMWVFIEVSAVEGLRGGQPLMMTCSEIMMGKWVYACEATKGAAQAFPLMSASVAFSLTLRFMFQLRFYYHAMENKVLIKYESSIPVTDRTVLLLTLSFVCGLCHFVMDLFFPPYVTMVKLFTLISVYVIPCCLFYTLLANVCDIHKHCAPLADIVERIPDSDKVGIGEMKMVEEVHMKASVSPTNQMYEDVDTFSIHDYIDHLVVTAQKTSVYMTAEAVEGFRKQGILAGNLLAGLWPGRILLDSRLSDGPCKSFIRVMRTFSVLFILAHVVIITGLLYQTWFSASHALSYRRAPSGAIDVQNISYVNMGSGYCRDVGGNRPDGYYRVVADDDASVMKHSDTHMSHMRTRRKLRHHHLATQSEVWTYSAALCNELGWYCLGFSTSAISTHKSLVALYFRGFAHAPNNTGWTDFALDWTSGAAAINQSRISTTDGNPDYRCWAKFNGKPFFPAIAAAIVFFVHAIIILLLFQAVVEKTMLSDFMKIGLVSSHDHTESLY